MYMLTLLASFFLPSHLSFKNMYIGTLHPLMFAPLFPPSPSMVLSFGKQLGPFRHPPPSDFAGLFEAAIPGDEMEVKLRPFLCLGTSQDLTVSGPPILTSNQGFVPAPIDTTSVTLPDPLHDIRDQLAHNLHEVWAKNKIEAGYRFAEVKRERKEEREGDF